LLHLVGHLYYSPTLMMHGETQIKSNTYVFYDLYASVLCNKLSIIIFILCTIIIMFMYSYCYVHGC